MAGELKCNICNRDFASADALSMHNAAKHGITHAAHSGKEKKPLNYKKFRNWGIFIAVIALIIAGVYALMANSVDCGTAPISEINIGGHTNFAMHIHPNLKIKILGVEETMPNGIGVEGSIMRPIHTHDSSGKLHLESPCIRNFKLKEFFELWGRNFNSTCIFEFCTNSTNSMKVTVNGKEISSVEDYNIEDYVMKDLDDIVIEYE